MKTLPQNTLMQKNAPVLFNQKHIRRHFNEEESLWYFSIIDIIEVLTDSTIPQTLLERFKT